MGRYRLKQGSHELELPAGDFLIGRGADCQLTLDDALVSRRHAVIHVRDDELLLEDLGSRNGVLVNGERQRGSAQLRPGDRIVIGSQELTVALTDLSRRATLAGFTQPIPSGLLSDPVQTQDTPPPPEVPGDAARVPAATPEPVTRTASSFTLLLGVARKAVALGKLDDASRILANIVIDWDRQLLSRTTPDQLTALDDAARLGVQLAAATGRVRWVDWLFDAFRKARRLLPADLIDELHGFVRKSRYPAGTPLRLYVEAMRDQEGQLRPAERFLLKRLEGLLEVAAEN